MRGDPGTGKSQLARAAACALNRRFFSEVVNAHTEIQDLWYRFDAVSRLGHAQVLGVTARDKPQEAIEAELDPRRYLRPGILWWAFDPCGAERHLSKFHAIRPDLRNGDDQHDGVILLIDEIDKADADLPNGLLETLDNGRFRIPWLEETIGSGDTGPQPLVVITTNEDRQLPGAFVRRCMVLNLHLPNDSQAFTRFMMRRGRQHFPGVFSPRVRCTVAEQLYADRLQARVLGVTPPGQAEFLDILRVLREFGGSDDQQLENLREIRDFALRKHPGMDRVERGGRED
ncbi:MAG: AAA family ATPase [Methylotetracoccus sp.]